MAKVTWTFQCLSDISDIGDYLALNSELYAERTVDLLLERGNMLENFPQMGRIVPEANLPSIREIIVKNYRIIYSLPDVNQVHILAVRHSSIPLDLTEL